MTKLFVRHNVSDFAIWYEGYTGTSDFRLQHGVTDAAVWQSVDDPTDVTVMHEFENTKAAKAFASDPQLKEIMQNLGVVGPPDIWFVGENVVSQ